MKKAIVCLILLTSHFVFAADGVSEPEKTLLCKSAVNSKGSKMEGSSKKEKLDICTGRGIFSKHGDSYMMTTPTKNGFLTCEATIRESVTRAGHVALSDCREDVRH